MITNVPIARASVANDRPIVVRSALADMLNLATPTTTATVKPTPNEKMAEAGRGFGKGSLYVVGGLFTLLIFIAAASLIHKELFARRTEIIKIEFIDAPRTCVSERRRGLSGMFSQKRQRSGVPQTAIGTGMYCGYIVTDRGSFWLPESGGWAIRADHREKIYDSIRPGCTYSAVIVGRYYGFQNVQPPQNTLLSIKRERPCDG